MLNNNDVLNEEIPRIAIAGIILGANVAVMIFLFSESNFLISNSFIHDFIYGFIRYGLLIDSILLYLYIASAGVLTVHNQKLVIFGTYDGLAREYYKMFYKYGVEFSLYIFTFSVVSYLATALFI